MASYEVNLHRSQPKDRASSASSRHLSKTERGLAHGCSFHLTPAQNHALRCASLGEKSRRTSLFGGAELIFVETKRLPDYRCATFARGCEPSSPKEGAEWIHGDDLLAAICRQCRDLLTLGASRVDSYSGDWYFAADRRRLRGSIHFVSEPIS